MCLLDVQYSAQTAHDEEVWWFHH